MTESCLFKKKKKSEYFYVSLNCHSVAIKRDSFPEQLLGPKILKFLFFL